jgi:isocitrate lyase
MGVTNDAEDQYYQEEVKQLKEWWSEPRWRFTKRPFTAEQIASKRGNLPIQYPSNAMSKKLWKILEQRFAVRSSIPGFLRLGTITDNECRAATQATHTDVSTRSW